MYQLNHSLHQNGTFGKRKGKIEEPNELAGDKLLRNDNGKFVDVSTEAGIYNSVIGYGLGLATGDVNNDGWPDIYVGNDFHENDYLYLNNQDGTFREVLTEQIQHTSRFSMGVDIADINNDGHRDVFSLDMLPEDPHILKSSLGEDGFDVFRFKLGFGYNPQFSRNTLQLNNGNGTFSEIGAFAGVEASDWSWGALFFDMNHDGLRDLFISNGIPRRMNDIDYINFKTNSELLYRGEFNDLREDDLEFVDKMPEIKLRNKFYINGGDLRFDDRSDIVTDADVSYSGSAVYVDLDNDGDLDVVTNNIDDQPYIYRNNIVDMGAAAGAWLKIEMQGKKGNRNGIGATAIVYAGEQTISYEHFPTRGYQSSALAPLHVSLGDPALVDSLVFVWPDRRRQSVPLGVVDTTIRLAYDPALLLPLLGGAPSPHYAAPAAAPKVASGEWTAAGLAISDITEGAGIDYLHEENSFVDFTREPLMPHMASAEGPGLAVGDVNGDGLEDFFVGSAKRRRSALYIQTTAGTFVNRTPEAMVADSVYEDVDAAFVDLNGDGHLDIVVAAGGNEYWAQHEPLLQRTYINDGTGNFERRDILPPIYLNAAVVLPADVNGDGLIDLFFGGRVVAKRYGEPPASHLLINKGGGRFEDETATWSDQLGAAGLITDGQWADMDGDGDQDLVLALEWQPITVYYNDGTRLTPKPVSDLKGWWTMVTASDLDGDGTVDIVAGNVGSNNKLRPSKAEPLEMYVNDFDDNDQPEQVMTYYVKGKKIPFASHAELIKQLPGLKKEYLFAQDLAGASLEEVFGKEKLRSARYYAINTLESYVFYNRGTAGFEAKELPDRAQFSTLNAVVPVKTGSSGTFWLTGGNRVTSTIEMGWYDASFLQGLRFMDGQDAAAQPLPGLRIDGVIRQLAAIQIGGRSGVLVARNDNSLRLLEIERMGRSR